MLVKDLMSIVLPRIFRDPPESQQNEAEANGEEDAVINLIGKTLVL